MQENSEFWAGRMSVFVMINLFLCYAARRCMGRILGIIGGGQLGMMITEAASALRSEISEVIVLDPTKNCPAMQAGAKQIVADFKDRNAIVELARKADIITYEIESGDSDVLASVEKDVEINPSPRTLKTIQDKLLQKAFLASHGIPVPEFSGVSDIDELRKAVKKFGYPVLLKARRDAYDGRGNYKIDSEGSIQAAWNSFPGRSLMVERFVPFQMEVSVIASRSTRGEIKTYPVVENMHEDNILRITIAPARVTKGIASEAERIAISVMDVLQGAGVFGIEMFVMGNGEVLVNEIAPRVHNSGHHTTHSSRTSQFEQHLRAILGMDLGSTELVRPAVMYNVLGSKSFEGRYQPITISEEGAYLKMYGKEISKPKRKLGHVNLVALDGMTVEDLLRRIPHVAQNTKTRPIIS